MRKIVLPFLVWAFLLAAMSSVSFAEPATENSNDDKVTPADIVKILEQQKQEKLDQLWKDVKESVVKKDFETAVSQLEEILKLDKNSKDVEEILAMLNDLTPPSSSGLPSQNEPSAKAGDRKTYTVNGVEFAFRYCPPGTFMMGSPESEKGRNDDEKLHLVTLTKGFWMMETEVTQKQWKAVMGTNPSYFKGDDKLPVERVSWNDCQEFCKKCTQLGLPVQLPTEAQWEYAYRAGSATDLLNGDIKILGKNNAPALDPIAWYAGNSSQGYTGQSSQNSSSWSEMQYPGGPCGTHPVGMKKPNDWGLYDMLGNVWEWCADWYGKDYPSGSVTDPTGPSTGSNRVFRGGSWGGYAQYCRSASRNGEDPMYRNGSVGFRVVKGQ